MSIHKSAIILLSIILSSCTASERITKIHATQSPPTQEIRSALVEYIRTTFYDPYSIRDSEISHVVRLDDEGLSAVCVKLNSKNRFGGYVGLTQTSFRMKSGIIIATLVDARGCTGLRYEPFKELEAL